MYSLNPTKNLLMYNDKQLIPALFTVFGGTELRNRKEGSALDRRHGG
jgi:hypothetical protein